MTGSEGEPRPIPSEGSDDLPASETILLAALTLATSIVLYRLWVIAV